MAILAHITTCGELISAALEETIAEVWEHQPTAGGPACHFRAVYLRRGAVGGRTKR
jgi:hypothetical protein